MFKKDFFDFEVLWPDVIFYEFKHSTYIRVNKNKNKKNYLQNVSELLKIGF